MVRTRAVHKHYYMVCTCAVHKHLCACTGACTGVPAVCVHLWVPAWAWRLSVLRAGNAEELGEQGGEMAGEVDARGDDASI